MHVKTVDKLYAVEVVKEEGERVKIHYVGMTDLMNGGKKKKSKM